MGQGPQGPQGLPGVPGKSVSVAELTSNPSFISTIQNFLVNDVNFKNSIQEYFKANASLFKGERGVTEFKLLSDSEQAAVIAQILKDNLNIFIDKLSENMKLQNAIVAVLQKNPAIKGKDGIQEKDIIPKAMWCADGNICKVPSTSSGIDLSGKKLLNGSIEGTDINTKNIVSEKGTINTLFSDSLGNRDGSKFMTGYGGYEVGYLIDGNDLSKGWKRDNRLDRDNYTKSIEQANKLTRDGLIINKGNIDMLWGTVNTADIMIGKKWRIWENDQGNLEFKNVKDNKWGILTNTGFNTGELRIGDWRIWQNDQGELEFKNEKQNKWYLAKNI